MDVIRNSRRKVTLDEKKLWSALYTDCTNPMSIPEIARKVGRDSATIRSGLVELGVCRRTRRKNKIDPELLARSIAVYLLTGDADEASNVLGVSKCTTLRILCTTFRSMILRLLKRGNNDTK